MSTLWGSYTPVRCLALSNSYQWWIDGCLLIMHTYKAILACFTNTCNTRMYNDLYKNVISNERKCFTRTSRLYQAVGQVGSWPGHFFVVQTHMWHIHAYFELLVHIKLSGHSWKATRHCTNILYKLCQVWRYLQPFWSLNVHYQT